MVILQQQHKDLSVLVWQITETDDELIKLLHNFDYYALQYAELKNKTRKAEFLVSRAALQHVLQMAVEVSYLPTGKPVLTNAKGFISISHTKGFVAVAYHPNWNVGIDIERPTERFSTIYTRFLNLHEQQMFFESTNLSKVLLAWSAKETLYKIIGNEAVDFANQLALQYIDIETKNICALHITSEKKYLLQFELCNEYALVFGVDKL